MNRHLYFRQQEKNALIHHGIKGQKWGVRRYQNEDGSYTQAGKERYGKNSESYLSKDSTYNIGDNVNEFKVTYKDDNVTCYNTKLKNGSELNIQIYEHAPDRSKDQLLHKYQNYALTELDKNVFSKIDSKVKEWKNDKDLKEALNGYAKENPKAKNYFNDNDNPPTFEYNFMRHPLAATVNWSINENDRITFLVSTDGEIRSFPHVT